MPTTPLVSALLCLQLVIVFTSAGKCINPNEEEVNLNMEMTTGFNDTNSTANICWSGGQLAYCVGSTTDPFGDFHCVTFASSEQT